jgi:hypothetical protein
MSTRTALLLTAAALLGTAGPAFGQDHGSAAGDEEIQWQQYEVVQQSGDEAYQAGAEASDAAEANDPWANMQPASRADRRDEYVRRRNYDDRQPEMYRSNAPRLAYSNEDREAWLADCRIVMRGDDSYYEDPRYEDDDKDGGLLGGLLGAVVGGVAGNRIGGSGDRLAGTLIGAGVGGVAGAVIGSAIDSSDHDERSERDAFGGWSGEYCEAYLRRYEASGQVGAASTQLAYAQPAAMRSGAMREIVREEWIDVPVEEDARPARQAASTAERAKLTPLN